MKTIKEKKMVTVEGCKSKEEARAFLKDHFHGCEEIHIVEISQFIEPVDPVYSAVIVTIYKEQED